MRSTASRPSAGQSWSAERTLESEMPPPTITVKQKSAMVTNRDYPDHRDVFFESKVSLTDILSGKKGPRHHGRS
jgi:alpha-ketoglutarate-dependent taurine dioxygenase